MESDDKQVGRILTRREAIALLGAAGASVAVGGVAANALADAAWSGASSRTPWLPACVVTPAQMEGPYFVDEKLNRIDIRPDPSNGKVSDGARLDLELRVYRVASGGCEPLAAAMVDLWQCDAAGVYSGVQDPKFFTTTGQKFLRGYQLTDAKGVARFTTVYPGWYQGRCVHVHFKVRTTAAGKNFEFTSQLYFDEAVTERVHANKPYAGKAGARTPNERDGIYRQGGTQLMLAQSERSGVHRGTFDIGMTL